ncbi:DUF1672 family protein [Anaerobacillus sp. 1_MG-2023]|uniref:DUF1672 family protein n=1 Tax=Anaerobacillus sp. 1_MG-2023 TaxID=3062655 RepID=UPI0026E19B36|nr:DUF1672 family protein [Anaerobacillus sp. 1_MG-2023]MDO6657836.1 DUF1672 family protein [Anaerobacillus sp. 1_MG-2023]
MIKKRFLLTGILCSALFLGGCSTLTNSNDETGKENEQKADKKTEEEMIEDKYFVSVQDYTGEEYTLDNGEETDKIAEENRDEVERAIKKYFKEEYKTEVKVHNIVGAIDGATVFVESVGKPQFYSYAIIPIDKDKREVDTEGVWSQEGQIETSIVSGLYAWIYENEFKELDKFVEKLPEEYPIVGIRKEVNENVGGGYYTTPYYNVTIFGGRIKELLPEYLENPNKGIEEWRKMVNNSQLDPSMISISIEMYMNEKDVEPDKSAFNEIVDKLTEKEGLPAGKYSFYLHDNQINKTNGQNNKENSLEKAAPHYLVND